MYSLNIKASWRFPVIGESIKRTLKIRERIRQRIRVNQYYGTTRLKRNYRLSFR